MKEQLEHCRNGQHHLDVIWSQEKDMGGPVVRWCRVCGSVVVDHDHDGRVNPGHYYTMRSPEIAKQ